MEQNGCRMEQDGCGSAACPVLVALAGSGPGVAAGREGVRRQDAACRGGSRRTWPLPANLLPARGPDRRLTPQTHGGGLRTHERPRGRGAGCSCTGSCRCCWPHQGLCWQGRTGAARARSPQRCPTRTGLMWGHGAAESAPDRGGALRQRGAGAALPWGPTGTPSPSACSDSIPVYFSPCLCPNPSPPLAYVPPPAPVAAQSLSKPLHQSQSKPLLQSHPSLLQPLLLLRYQPSPSPNASPNLSPSPSLSPCPSPIPNPSPSPAQSQHPPGGAGTHIPAVLVEFPTQENAAAPSGAVGVAVPGGSATAPPWTARPRRGRRCVGLGLVSRGGWREGGSG